MGSSAGGAFLPSDPPPSTGQVLTNPTISGATISGTVTLATGATLTNPSIVGAAITGTVTMATGATITNPALVGATVTGVVTIASGATITTPTVLFTAQDVIATGATGTTAAALSAVTPVLVNCNATGVSGAGVAFPTGAALAGALYVIKNSMTGALKVYAVGGTINGTTGTTAYSITATGNLGVMAICTVAGAWQIVPLAT